MIDIDYAAGQMACVWKMAWNAPDWEESFDRSVDGVFKSFWAMLFTAPVAFAGFFSLRRAASRTPDFSDLALIEAPFAFSAAAAFVSFLADWTASLVALVLAARATGASRRIADVIIGFNWTQFFTALAQTAPLVVLGLTGEGKIASVLLLPSAAFVIAFYWGFLRRSLKKGVAVTIALLVMLTLLGLVVSSLVDAGAIGLYRLFS